MARLPQVMKFIDNALDLTYIEKKLAGVEISRSELLEIVESMKNSHNNIKVTLNIGQNGNIEPEILLKGDSAINFLINQKKEG